MLGRAALRSIRPSSSTSYVRHASPTILPLAAQRIRAYASKPPSRPPPPPKQQSPPQPASSRKTPPPPQSFQSVSKTARQTSPGTSFPKDKTWQPQDGIKFAGAPGAAISSGHRESEPSETATGELAGSSTKAAKGAAGEVEAVHASNVPHQSSVSANRPNATTIQDSAPQRDTRGAQRPLEHDTESPLDTNTKPGEPLAQRVNVDRPMPGDVRDDVHEKQASSENTAAAADAETAEPTQPQQPLPDLRQGIPSTFNFEFGGQGQQQTGRQSTGQQEKDELDITYEEAEGQRQRDRGERDYDNSAYETSLDRRRAQLANYLYASIVLLSATGAFYLSRPFNPNTESLPYGFPETEADGWSPGKMYARVRARIGDQLGYYTEPTFTKLLPEVPENQRQPFTLVLSLEDLMVHSSWSREHGYRTAKRPGIDYFIRYLSQYYELVLFTSVPIAMADPVIKKLDPYHFIMWPLGREATKYEGGEYVKDLAYLNRDLKKTIIVDTHAPHVRNQPENAIVIPKWSGDPKDPKVKDLVALIPFLEYVATMGTDDVRNVLKSFEGKPIPEEFARREALAREKFHAQLEQEKSKRPRHSIGSLGSALGIKSSPAMGGGGMVLADGQSVAEGLAQGKMLSDQIREQGQKQYEFLEKQIREHGAQWLKEEEEEQKKMMEAQMKDMKKSASSWFGGGKNE